VIAEALAAAAHRLGDDRDAVLARLGGPLGTAARAAAAALAGDSRRTRAEWAARARAPVPAGLRGVHPTWIEAALAGLPERARAALAGNAGPGVAVVAGAGPDVAVAAGVGPAGAIAASAGPTGAVVASAGPTVAVAAGAGPTDVWLARRATAGFVPLPPVRPGPPRTPSDVAALAPDEARRWLGDIGLDQLALALTGQEVALGPAFDAARAHRPAAARRCARIAAGRARALPRPRAV
jgi:hypothetical protein